jgi:hypothetical protein
MVLRQAPSLLKTGGVVNIKNDSFPLWIGCGKQAVQENRFLCCIEPSKPFIRRLLKKIDAQQAVKKVADALEMMFSSDEEITEIEWRPEPK